MIEEIKNPLPTIQDFLDNKKQENKKKRRRGRRKNNFQKYNEKRWAKTNLTDYDVAFNTDTAFVKEFAEREGISYTMAEACLIAFFEELKAQLMDGKVIFVGKVGKFYISGPHRDQYGKFSMPIVNKTLVPKLKPFKCIRDYDKNFFKNEETEEEDV